ncbi:MAG TPA: bifunctional YncE family protein/alkaline phosphatase family protein [Acidisarcina sp.]|nr:bifunctional YncE family protein/alkaline phosphatase family protein [Acidisarcina sp.]
MLLKCAAAAFFSVVFFASAFAQNPVAHPHEVVLPNGRVIQPEGKWIKLAPFPFALTVRPDGRQIAAPSIGWPFSLNVIDDPSGESPEIHRVPARDDNDPTVQVHMQVAYSLDGKLLYDPTGDSGAVDIYASSDWRHIARIPLDGAIGGINFKESFAAAAVLSPDGRLLYVLDQGNWRVVVIDLSSNKPVASMATGSNPLAIALSSNGRRLYVANSGLFEYQLVSGAKPSGLRFPPFGYPSKAAREGTIAEGHSVPALGDENNPRGSSLWTYDVATPQSPRLMAELRLGSRIAEGRNNVVGGASPSGIATSTEHVYVSLAHEDSIAVVSPDGAKLEQEIALSPFTGRRYEDKRGRPLRGVMPFGLAQAAGRLYVAESGINSVAVIDTNTNHVLTHIPVGWYPAAIVVSPDGRSLYVVNSKGKGSGPNIGPDLTHISRQYIGELEFGSLSVIRLPVAEDSFAASSAAVVKANEASVAESRPLPRIGHVFLIIRENRTYDEVFGDLAKADGEPKLARFGLHGWAEEDPAIHDVSVTPNAHALAERFATSDHFYVNSDVSADGHRWAVGIAPAPWMNIAWASGYGGRRTGSASSEAPGRRALGGGADSPMPEDEPEFGSLWEHVAGAGLPLMNYGEGLEVEGSDEREGTEPEGQRLFLNAPVPEPVFVSTDRHYPTFNLGIPDQYRYAEFLRDFTRRSKTGYRAALTVIRLPNDHMASPRPADGYPYRVSYVADNDLALGKIVDTISHSAIWKDSAIFVIEDDAQGGVDHVDAHRSPVLVMSPYVRKGYISHRHTSMASVQKTIYELLRLGPLNLEDALSADMSDMFTDTPDLAPYRFAPSDKRIFDSVRARLAHPKTAAEKAELLDMDDPDEIAREFHSKPHISHPD